jgi:hypothetical protein
MIRPNFTRKRHRPQPKAPAPYQGTDGSYLIETLLNGPKIEPTIHKFAVSNEVQLYCCAIASYDTRDARSSSYISSQHPGGSDGFSGGHVFHSFVGLHRNFEMLVPK